MRRKENKPREELIEELKELKELKQKYADLQAAYKKSSARNKLSDEKNKLAIKEWQTTFDAIDDIVILLKPNHEIIKANKAALEALNKTPDEIAGKKCYHIVHNTDSPILGCPCEEACKEKRSVIKEYFQNGRFYELSAWPVFDENNIVVWFTHVVKDITERKKFIEDLKIEKEKAQAADRLKTAFLNNISHEVRTPLNGILGFGQMMAEADLSKEEKEMYLKILKQSSNRLINTITDFMDISLIASGNVTVNKKIFPIAPLLNELGELYGSQCKEKGLEFKLFLPPDTEKAEVESDAGLLKKVFMHLLNNALKFTGEGTIKMGYALKQDTVECFVGDTGKGIEAEMQDLVFNRFTQEDTRIARGHEGSGLGLSISKGLVELLGGEIELKSEKGKGTTVSFTLPRTGQEIDHESPGSLSQSAGGNVVLIAEDDYMNRLFMETILKRAGIQFVSVEDGQEAVEQCRDNPDIGLVLMDLKMPVMDGLEATRQIKAFEPELPVIAITAQAMHGDKQKALDAGCDDYIGKPIEKKLLFEKIMQFNNL